MEQVLPPPPLLGLKVNVWEVMEQVLVVCS